MKWLLIPALLAYVGALGMSGEPNKGSGQHESCAINHGQTNVTFNNEIPAAKAETPHNSSPWLYAAVKRPDWWLVIIAAFTGVAIWRQATEANEATKAMRDSIPHQQKAADAAGNSAEALINAERPWIVAKITRVRSPSVEIWGGVGKTENSFRQISFGVTFRNYGRTPAKIVSVRAIPEVLKQTEARPDIPAYVGQMPLAFLGERMLVPGERWVWPEGSNLVSAIVSAEEFKDINSGKQLFAYFGRIEYRDIFQPKTLHETRFSYIYRYKIDEFVIEGPPDYNQYT